MKCRECDEFLVDYVAGELPADVQATFELHVSRCRNCRVYLEQYRATIRAGKDACTAVREAGMEMPEELIRAILASRPEKTRE